MQLWFAFLEGTIALFAINNLHYSIYYLLPGLLGLLIGWKAYQWRKTNSKIKGLSLFVHITFGILTVISFFIGILLFIFTQWTLQIGKN